MIQSWSCFPFCVKDRQAESAFSAGMLDEVNTKEEELTNTAHPAAQEGLFIVLPGKKVQDKLQFYIEHHVQQSAQTKTKKETGTGRFSPF